MLKKWLYASVIAALLSSTLILGLAAYRYRDYLLAIKLENLEQRETLRTLQQKFESAERNLAAAKQETKQLARWAPGIIQSYALRREGISPREAAKEYKSTGSYLGYKPKTPTDRGRLRFDKDGLPTVQYGASFHYNPVTIAQFALQEYGGSEGPTSQFMVAVKKLLSMQSSDGAFRYDFPYTKYATGEAYEPGWASGMAQGQALSVFARAYAQTGDKDLIEAGNRALRYMMLPFEEGGTATTLALFPPEHSNAPFIMEYPQDPPVYTLNGYMFSILGLFDWANVTENADAKKHANKAIDTLKILLPYYDLGVVSAYDLSFITVPRLRSRRTQNASRGK